MRRIDAWAIIVMIALVTVIIFQRADIIDLRARIEQLELADLELPTKDRWGGGSMVADMPRYCYDLRCLESVKPTKPSP